MWSIRPGSFTLVLAISLGAMPGLARAQPSPPSDQALKEAQAEVERLKQELAVMRSGYDARLAALEERINALATTPVPAPAPEAAPAPQAEPAPSPQVA
ncbi:MAG TPA: hypothetical protein VM820_04660, partial [Vicinamibacterales bacterium]|nr:hypothetical protein [Vicinamibacterales bacterium]